MATKLSVSFDIYNKAAVKRLQEEDPDILPTYSVDKAKDLAYNKKQVNAAITSAILQGKSVPNIAKDLQSRMSSLNSRSAVKTARTAVTSAQNAGKLSSMQELAAMGVEVQKEWVATLDSRTRPSHQRVDGQRREPDERFSNGLQYPGDSSGPSSEVWWCRCTMKSYLPKYSDYNAGNSVRWSRNPTTGAQEYVPRMTYSEWIQSKQYASADTSSYGMAKITKAAIDSVPYVAVSAIGETASKTLQVRCKEVLTEAAKHEVGTEVGMACDVAGNKIWSGVGEEGAGNVRIPSYSTDYISIHNHPDGQTFSGTDLASFIYAPNQKVAQVIGNDGTVYSLTKTDNYDGMAAYTVLKNSVSTLNAYVQQGDADGYIRQIEKIIKELSKYGVEFNTSSA